jgi:hypothetical protein
MKRILFALAVFGLVFPAAPRAHAEADVSIDFFYNNLGDDGSWIEVGDYGYCWQPNVAANDANWRPYADGYWAYTDVGWTWVSYESFGWATYHYGRWARVADHGWLWVPGTEWGPAWVSWRTGGDYVGWAPLPPRRVDYGEPIYEGRPITSRVDIEFSIGPSYYNFCDVRYIGEPVLRQRIFEPTQNITYINQTVNVTNITYSNNVVYNNGPDYNYLSAYSTRPIQRLRLQRETNLDPLVAARSGGITRVQGDQLMVAAPLRVRRADRMTAPKFVKTRLDRPNLETGWMGVTDPNAKVKLEEKMKGEDSKAVPPPRVQPVRPEALKQAAAAQLGAAPAPNASPVGETAAAGGTPAPEAAPVLTGKDKRGNVNPVAQPNAAASAAPVMSGDRKGKGKDKRPFGNPLAQPTATPDTGTAMPAISATPGSPADQGNVKGKDKNRRLPNDLLRPTNQPVPTLEGTGAPQSTPAPDAGLNELKGKGRRQKPQFTAPPATVPPPTVPPQADANQQFAPSGPKEGKAKHGRVNLPNADAAQGTTAGPSAPQDVPQSNDGKAKQREQFQRQMAPPQQVAPRNVPAAAPHGAPAQGQQKGGGKPKKEKKDDEKPGPPQPQ